MKFSKRCSLFSCRAIEKVICYHRQGHETSTPCTSEHSTYYMLMFGAVQLFTSQIPDMHNLGWLSLFATFMSFCYSTIGIALGFSQVLGIYILFFILNLVLNFQVHVYLIHKIKKKKLIGPELSILCLIDL